MIEPSIKSLLEKADCRFTLCIMVGKRARELTNGARQLVETESNKSVSVAINEINENKIVYIRTKSSIK